MTDVDMGMIGASPVDRTEVAMTGNDELVRHVAASTGLPEATATRVVADIAAYFAETIEDYVRRRHGEMRLAHRKNGEIWLQLAAELGARRFGAPELSERQLRRMVYG